MDSCYGSSYIVIFSNICSFVNIGVFVESIASCIQLTDNVCIVAYRFQVLSSSVCSSTMYFSLLQFFTRLHISFYFEKLLIMQCNAYEYLQHVISLQIWNRLILPFFFSSLLFLFPLLTVYKEILTFLNLHWARLHWAMPATA